MRFGVCTQPEHSQAVKNAGYDHIEFSVQHVLRGLDDDAAWEALASQRTSALPTPAANLLVPAALKVTGPDASIDKLRTYIERVCSRAAKVGCKVLVFGSGGARQVPDGFDRNRAYEQLTEFLAMAGPIAHRNGVTIVVEPLNRKECNVFNSIGETLPIVRKVNHPGVAQLLDTYHLWLEDEPLEHIREAGKLLKHVHLADRDGRVAPGISGTSDYAPVFKILKQIGYDGIISIEAGKFEIEKDGTGVLAFLKSQWQAA